LALKTVLQLPSNEELFGQMEGCCSITELTARSWKQAGTYMMLTVSAALTVIIKSRRGHSGINHR
jgi:hypothetical protein